MISYMWLIIFHVIQSRALNTAENFQSMQESWNLAVLCHLDLNLLFLLYSEIAKYEEILIDYKRYKDLLFKLSPPEWQEAQKAKVLSNKETQDCQKKKPEESAIRNGKYFTVI